MISDARGGHVSPGIYTEEKDVTYSVKSLGITSLGLVGETLYGPAFENIEIENWGEFVDYFGGTSPEKFKGNGLPKYELPYIAKSYLEESKRLNVVRVLGLSGYHAGPAWVLKSDDKLAGVLRSKMVYDENSDSICESANDTAKAVVTKIEVGAYTPSTFNAFCTEGNGTAQSIDDDKRFSLKVTTNGTGGFINGVTVYNVSLNPNDSDYIYKVISSNPSQGTTPIYIEAIYENSIENAIEKGNLTKAKLKAKIEYFGKRNNDKSTSAKTIYDIVKDKPNNPSSVKTATISGDTLIVSSGLTEEYISYTKEEDIDVYDDFTEMYRPAQSPWIISEAYASTENNNTTVAAKKLFKIVSISDGDAANFQIKVSFQNIKPEEGLFDVIVRDFNDSDAFPVILERFTKCSMVEGDASYIGFKIGTTDGGFASKSKFIAVEIADGEDLGGSVPAGFIGYPMPKYGLDETLNVKYNTEFKPSMKAKKQYFGLNSEVIDSDILKYKGVYAYEAGDADPSKITNGFHLDAIIDKVSDKKITIDGVSGYNMSCVSSDKVTTDEYIPRIINASYMNKSIYKDVNARKFTVYLYGGFDGWDINREKRTNTDNFKASRYSMSGSQAFTIFENSGMDRVLNLPPTAITSDYYAYLAGYRTFANPQDVDINVFATPGINWYDNLLLTEDAIDMIEDKEDGRGGDALYIMAAPYGMSAEEAAIAFAESDINSSYACTYYPWVMFYDSSNKKYLNLPVTKDIVRNMAATDNNSYPWFAPAGIERGSVKCVKADFKTTLADEDVLYENAVNPIKTFAQDGVKVWGNKTAYKTESPLNRINVRRLMIRVQKLVKDAAKHLIFEQYDDTLEKQFRGLVDPILADVKANRGIYDYRIITEVTPETRDQHILPAKILIKPTPSLEYISISFVVYPESVEFEEN